MNAIKSTLDGFFYSYHFVEVTLFSELSCHHAFLQSGTSKYINLSRILFCFIGILFCLSAPMFNNDSLNTKTYFCPKVAHFSFQVNVQICNNFLYPDVSCMHLVNSYSSKGFYFFYAINPTLDAFSNAIDVPRHIRDILHLQYLCMCSILKSFVKRIYLILPFMTNTWEYYTSIDVDGIWKSLYMVGFSLN